MTATTTAYATPWHTLTVEVTYRHDHTRYICGEACPGHAEWDEDARAEHEYSLTHPEECDTATCLAAQEVREFPDENELDRLPTGTYRVRGWCDPDDADGGLYVEELVAA